MKKGNPAWKGKLLDKSPEELDARRKEIERGVAEYRAREAEKAAKAAADVEHAKDGGAEVNCGPSIFAANPLAAAAVEGDFANNTPAAGVVMGRCKVSDTGIKAAEKATNSLYAAAAAVPDITDGDWLVVDDGTSMGDIYFQG